MKVELRSRLEMAAAPIIGSLRPCRLLRALKEAKMFSDLVPGMLVRHPEREDWGVGHVQSVDRHRVTVNFEHVGKQLINVSVVNLIEVKGG